MQVRRTIIIALIALIPLYAVADETTIYNCKKGVYQDAACSAEDANKVKYASLETDNNTTIEKKTGLRDSELAILDRMGARTAIDKENNTKIKIAKIQQKSDNQVAKTYSKAIVNSAKVNKDVANINKKALVESAQINGAAKVKAAKLKKPPITNVNTGSGSNNITIK